MSIKPILISTLLLSFLSSYYSSDCGTPVECYVKALDVLNNARNEYREKSERFQKQIDELNQTHTNKISEVKAKLEQDNQNLKTELGVQINSLTTQNTDLRNQINMWKSDNADLRNQLNGIYRYGGSYQIDDCGTNNIGNPLGSGLGCPSGYTPRNVGRVKCPEGRGCGGTQYICLK